MDCIFQEPVSIHFSLQLWEYLRYILDSLFFYFNSLNRTNAGQNNSKKKVQSNQIEWWQSCCHFQLFIYWSLFCLLFTCHMAVPSLEFSFLFPWFIMILLASYVPFCNIIQLWFYEDDNKQLSTIERASKALFVTRYLYILYVSGEKLTYLIWVWDNGDIKRESIEASWEFYTFPKISFLFCFQKLGLNGKILSE